jgi:mannose-1-phosphate guanylyltransferase/mannose-6-phosphate isomerase
MFPKQFVRFSGDQGASFLAATMRRLSPAEGFERPIIVCNKDHRFLVRDEAHRVGTEPEAIVLEPLARNTAPAIAVAALIVQRAEPDGLLVVMPSDHVITDEAGFLAAVRRAGEVAATGRLVLFGIAPYSPHTGYGYIRRGQPLPGLAGAFAVAEFTEKPDRETAEGYIASREYYWNSGIFVLGARAFVDELEHLDPAVLAAAKAALAGALEGEGFLQLGSAFERAPNISVDYAVMEDTALGAVLPVDVGWSDVGSWSSLWELSRRDAEGNAVQGEAVLEATEDCYIHSEKALVATIGVDNLVIVNTPDALLVADKARAQDVGTIVARLRKEKRKQHASHVRAHQPWGFSEALQIAPSFRVDLLSVNAGATLARQMQPQGVGHWVVVQGTADVTIGSERGLVHAGQSINLAPGQLLNLRNQGPVPLELIEVLMGSGAAET